MTASRKSLARWLREPLLHFLAIGALIFAGYGWLAGDRRDSSLIVVTPGQVDKLAATFTRTWQRPPSQQELKAQLDDHVREEIATREAMAGGLDRNDSVVRRRLRQKLEAMVVDITVDTAEVSDAELQAWLDRNADKFRREPRIAFRQVFLSPRKRGQSISADIGALRDELAKAGPDADTERLGDPLMVPGEVALSEASTVARLFGEEFARAVFQQEPGRWTGPVSSTFGVHIVLVRERLGGQAPALAQVRPQVQRLYDVERRQQRLEEMYTQLLEKYRIVIEPRPPDAPVQANAAP